MNKLDKLILKQQQIARQIRLEREEEKKAAAAKKPAKRRGRPRIDSDTLKKIEAEAYTKPLTDVALKYNVCSQTLYNYGITREALNAKSR